MASPAATKDGMQQQGPPRASTELVLFEVNPKAEDPEAVHAIRELNQATLSDVLGPRRNHSRTSAPTVTEDVWYLSSSVCHHITGNLDLLNNLSPVSDRWVRNEQSGPPTQALARGSVNCNGIILDDVWYINGSINIVSVNQLKMQGLLIQSSPYGRIIKRGDGTVAGKAHVGPRGYFELEFISTATSGAPWYIVSNVQEHMTGNLELLTGYKPMWPSRPVRTHAGAMLQVCGKGSLKKQNFHIPDISYVPGLKKNVVSISQLLDSGFAVKFSMNGCIIKRNRDSLVFGVASYGGDQELYRLRAMSP